VEIPAYLRTFCTRNPATIPIVVGNEAAQTPSRFNVFSSIFSATTNGGAHFGKEKHDTILTQSIKKET
jgi:hypothetical protein